MSLFYNLKRRICNMNGKIVFPLWLGFLLFVFSFARDFNSNVHAGGPSPLGNKMAVIAKEELKKWKGVTETNSKVSKILRSYWSSVRLKYSEKQLQDPKFQETHPWSSAFISWVVKEAGAGNQFQYSAAHWRYIAAAKANHVKNKKNPFKAYRINEVKPQVGDIVCQWRNSKKKATYDNINAPHQTHGDIVVEVTKTKLITIGGNVSNTVRISSVPLNAQGFIAGGRYFAVVKVGEK